jgi:hypothetical protein
VADAPPVIADPPALVVPPTGFPVPPVPPFCGAPAPEQAIRPASANNGSSETHRVVGMFLLNFSKIWLFYVEVMFLWSVAHNILRIQHPNVGHRTRKTSLDYS